MEVVGGRGILVRVRNPERYTSVLNDCIYIGDVGEGVHELMVRWNRENVDILTKLGLKNVPSTIKKDYKWPGAFTPMSHQKDTASFIVNNQKCFVFNEAGVGKTASAAWASDYLMSLGLIKRVLVVCPLSIVHAAWRRDLFNVVPHRRVGVAHGSVKTRREIITGDYEYVIINFDGVEIVLDELIASNFDMIIVDEANHLKNVQTRRWRTFKKLVKPETRLIMMTGTPAAQSPEDAYGLAKLVNPTKVPAFFGAWKATVMQKMSMFKWMPKSNAKDLVFKVLQPAIRFTKQECLDLPDMMYEVREVPLTSQQKKYYDKLKKQMLIEAAGEEISAVNAAAKLTKLLQISCGSVYSDEGNTVHFDVSSRMNELEAIIDECLHKVIVFAPFTHTIEMIEEFLTRKKHTCAVINGAVSLSKRSAIIEKFQNDPMLRVIIIQPQAAAHGITLTAADTVVWFGPTTSVETFIQANSRAHRKGQHNKVTVYMIQGSPAESKIYASLNKKIDEHEHLIALYNDIINS